MSPKMLVYVGLWVLWVLAAIPTAVFNIFLFREPPLWPHFSSRATAEGTIVWLFMVLWIYAVPLGLIASRRWWLKDKRQLDARN